MMCFKKILLVALLTQTFTILASPKLTYAQPQLLFVATQPLPFHLLKTALALQTQTEQTPTPTTSTVAQNTSTNQSPTDQPEIKYRSTPKYGLLALGITSFIISYVPISALGLFVHSCSSDDAPKGLQGVSGGGCSALAPGLAVPVVGPLFYVPSAQRSFQVLLVTDFLLQGGGVAMSILSFAYPNRVPISPSTMLVPMMDHGRVGLNLSQSF